MPLPLCWMDMNLSSESQNLLMIFNESSVDSSAIENGNDYAYLLGIHQTFLYFTFQGSDPS